MFKITETITPNIDELWEIKPQYEMTQEQLLNTVIEKCGEIYVSLPNNQYTWGETHTNHDYNREVYSRIPPNGYILDIGCGGGDAICMCNVSTRQRYQFFKSLSDRKCSVFTDLKIRNLEKTKRLYEKCWCVIGHTMSPHEGIYTRSLKAWRDWIGPCTNTILIYDNHPTIVEYFDGIVPTYDYNNPYSFLDSLYTFIINPQKYMDILNKQKSWLKNNTIEKQLLPLIEGII